MRALPLLALAALPLAAAACGGAATAPASAPRTVAALVEPDPAGAAAVEIRDATPAEEEAARDALARLGTPSVLASVRFGDRPGGRGLAVELADVRGVPRQ